MKNRVVYIYILIDPRNETVRYVGRSYNLKKRLSQHNSIWLPKTKKEKWLCKLKSLGLSAEIECIHTTDEFEWVFWETHYISLFKSYGYDLTNGNGGGVGGCNPSEETRDKMRLNMLNATDVHRNRLSKSGRGRMYSDEHKAKLSKSHVSNDNANLRVPLMQLNKDGSFVKEWISGSEVSRHFTGFSNRGGTLLSSMKRNGSAYGFKWVYKSDYYNNILLDFVKKIPMFS